MSRSKTLITFLLLCLTGWCTAVANAQTAGTQDLQVIRAIVRSFVLSQIGPLPDAAKVFIDPGTLDARLRLPACAAPQGFLPPGAKPAARFTVGIRCDQPAWSVYIPTNIESELSILVLKQAASRGASIDASDVDSQIRRVPGFATLYLTDPASLTGRHLKQATPPGTALTSELLVQDSLIRRGQRVTLLASTGGFEVRATGEAVSDAGPTGRVRVQNLNSLKIVEGQAISADTVRVGP
jgi:flagella basal body P-ring formation protein FlgA